MPPRRQKTGTKKSSLSPFKGSVRSHQSRNAHEASNLQSSNNMNQYTQQISLSNQSMGKHQISPQISNIIPTFISIIDLNIPQASFSNGNQTQSLDEFVKSAREMTHYNKQPSFDAYEEESQNALGAGNQHESFGQPQFEPTPQQQQYLQKNQPLPRNQYQGPSPYDLDQRIKENIDRFFLHQLVQNQSKNSEISSQTNQGVNSQGNINQPPVLVIDQNSSLINSSSGDAQNLVDRQFNARDQSSIIIEQQKMIYTQIIDSFTSKIETLQSVISDQKVQLDTKDKEILKLKTAAIKAEGAAEVLRNSSRSPMRDVLESSLRSKYFNMDEVNNHSTDTQYKLRELESNRIQMESENKAFLTQIGKLQAENKVFKQEIDRMQHREITFYERAEKDRVTQAQVSEIQAKLGSITRELELEKARTKSMQAKEDEHAGVIIDLRRQLELEKRSTNGEAESYRNLLNRVQTQNRELQQEVEKLKEQKVGFGNQFSPPQFNINQTFERDHLQQTTLRVRKNDAQVSCQILTTSDLQDFQNQISTLNRELEVERKRTESLTFKILARDDEIRKIKDSANASYNNQIQELRHQCEKLTLDLQSSQNLQGEQRSQYVNLSQDLTRSKEEYQFLESQYQELLQKSSKVKAIDSNKAVVVVHSDAQTTCQIITVRDIQDFQAQAEKLERDLQSERVQLDKLRAQLDKKEKEMQEMHANNQHFQGSREDEEIVRLQEVVQRKSEEVEEVRSECEYAQSQCQQMQGEIKKLRNEAAQVPRLQKLVKDKEDQVGNQIARISELSQIVSELEDRQSRQGQDGAKIQSLQDALERAKSEAQFKIDSLIARVGRMDSEIAEKNKTIELLNTQIQKNYEQIASLKVQSPAQIQQSPKKQVSFSSQLSVPEQPIIQQVVQPQQSNPQMVVQPPQQIMATGPSPQQMIPPPVQNQPSQIIPNQTVEIKSVPQQVDSGTYIFTYGSNHPVSFSKLLSTSVQELLSRSISCGLPKYGRVFVGESQTWQGGSFAHIIQHENSEVEGYAVRLRPDEIQLMDKIIGCPQMYKREKFKLKRLPYSEGDALVDGEVYILIEKQLLGKYKKPSTEQLDACIKTLSTSLYLRIGSYEDKKHPLVMNVFNGAKIKKDFEHKVFASMKFLAV